VPASTRALRGAWATDTRLLDLRIHPPRLSGLGCGACGGPTLTLAGPHRTLTGCEVCFTRTRVERIFTCAHARLTYPSRQPRGRAICLRCGVGLVKVTIHEAASSVLAFRDANVADS
jgi:hypothetical protein